MIDLSGLKNTHPYSEYAYVLGLGKSGYATAHALIKNGWTVYVWDDNETVRGAAKNYAAKDGISLTFHEAKPDDTKFFAEMGIFIPSPGIPHTHPYFDMTKAQDVKIIGDMELLHLSNHGRKTIGVTGTNGKSTATALIAHILNENGIEALAAGNIGTPVLDINLPGEDGVLVLELSSYQIELCPAFRPDIGVLLNITPDHIDRHGTFENYKAIKMGLLEGAGIAIHEEDTHLAAAKVAREFGLNDEQIEAAIKTYKPLPHRQQFVCRIGNVDYINDSKATNAESTKFALKSFDDIYLIAGGLAKEGGLDGIEEYKDKIRHVFLIGKDTEAQSNWLKKQSILYTRCGQLEKAVTEAHEMAQEAGTGTVLLSPACASFDQFESFEQRGEQFMIMVNALRDIDS